MTLPIEVLVILFEGAPVRFAYEVVDARDFLADILEEHGESFQVYRVFAEEQDAKDITTDFANEWAGDLGYGDGDDPDEFLRPFTGFVLGHIRDDLIREYRASQDHADSDAFERSKIRSL
ncbi:hypothetical protein JP75_07555 [Devosia riboflavina]|uniref:Uncharacterized protein n=1 Tax=Devosia riboflavina TaxID=46914 RepID=A0A087M3F8_9HYPH|nr:hypothetical protein [Devosia riboflavina]KFL31411.1 hypothetical protein JP75_07555 [Devosia riboflavina]